MANSKQIRDFLNTMAPMIQKEAQGREKWIIPSVVIAQSIIESAWGTQALMINANAPFGIKADEAWCKEHKFYSGDTKECYDGTNYTDIKGAKFRAYDNLQEAIKNYYDMVTGMEVYQDAVNEPDYIKAAHALSEYATAPDYAKKIIAVIEGSALTDYDTVIRSKHSITAKKSIDDIAKEVLQGKWGNGAERKARLETDGYEYLKVQAKVNELCASSIEAQKPQPTPVVKPVVSAPTVNIKKGDKVKVINEVDYKGVALHLWHSVYDVIDINNDRVVIGIGEVVTAAMNIKDIKRI